MVHGQGLKAVFDLALHLDNGFLLSGDPCVLNMQIKVLIQNTELCHLRL
jgi:hypothetical protein